ncbi:MAG: Lrp/AsnC family transcriptional regulator [Cypionkella sp.]
MQKEGWISIQNRGERIGLIASPVARRLGHLEDSGIIAGYVVLIDEVALGYGISVFVSVKLIKQVDVGAGFL